MNSRFLQAFEYLRSFQADGRIARMQVDTHADTIHLEGTEPDFFHIVAAYVETNWGVRVVPRTALSV